MRRFFFYLGATLLLFSAFATRPALAQSEYPPTGPVGEIHGTIINRNSDQVVAESLDVMLHVLDQDLNDKDMQHAQSDDDGTFDFVNIPFDANLQFIMMVTYQGVTYSSQVTPVDLKSAQLQIDVPVYESTSDLTGVQIDQMHVMFDLAEDGLETKEIYVISNSNERTVKDVFQVDEQHSATLRFPLPVDADYIFFKPDEQDRFIKFGGSFADTNPLLPKSQSTQFMVSYLVPYIGEREYTYTAPLNVAQINFLIPDQSGISLQGSGLMGPESMILENGKSYKVYSYVGLNAGQTVSVSIGGDAGTTASDKKGNNPLAMGAAFLGFVIIGVSVWWWRRPENDQNGENEVDSNETTLDKLILEIAELDEDYEQGRLSVKAHKRLRQELMRKAKLLSNDHA